MLNIDQSLVRRLELAHAWRGVHYARAQQTLHPETSVEVKSIAGGFAIFAGEGSPLNGAVGLGFQGPVSGPDIFAVERFFESRNIPARIDLSQLADPSLAELLTKRNYSQDMSFNVLYCSLPQSALTLSPTSGLKITQAKSEDADLWIRTVGQGFDGREHPSQETLDIMAPNFYSGNGSCFFAWLDREPAGGGAMYIHEGVAEFGGTSTRPQFRRRGVQTALLAARLKAAAAQDCNYAMVMTSPNSASQRNLERAGFRLGYTKAVMVRRGKLGR